MLAVFWLALRHPCKRNVQGMEARDRGWDKLHASSNLAVNPNTAQLRKIGKKTARHPEARPARQRGSIGGILRFSINQKDSEKTLTEQYLQLRLPTKPRTKLNSR